VKYFNSFGTVDAPLLCSFLWFWRRLQVLRLTSLTYLLAYLLTAANTAYKNAFPFRFYSASALLAMRSAVLARPFLSVCPSHVRHVPVLCRNKRRYDRVVFSIW